MIIESVYNDSIQTTIIPSNYNKESDPSITRLIRMNLVKRLQRECDELDESELRNVLKKTKLTIVRVKEGVPTFIGTLTTPLTLSNDDGNLASLGIESSPEMARVNVSELLKRLRDISRTPTPPGFVDKIGIKDSFPLTSEEVQASRVSMDDVEDDTYSDTVKFYNTYCELLGELGELDPKERLYSAIESSKSPKGLRDSQYADPQMINLEIVIASSVLALDQVMRSNPFTKITDEMLTSTSTEVSDDKEVQAKVTEALIAFRDSDPQTKSKIVENSLKVTRDQRSGMTKLQRRALRISILIALIGALAYWQRGRISNANKLAKLRKGSFSIKDFVNSLVTKKGRNRAVNYTKMKSDLEKSETFLRDIDLIKRDNELTRDRSILGINEIRNILRK